MFDSIFEGKLLILFFHILIFSCQNQSANTELSQQDISQIRQIKHAYTSGWVEDDTSRVINLFAEDAMIIPSSLQPKAGKQAIYDFWWAEDGSTTNVTSYEIDILEIGGNSQFAYSYENGKLSFIYDKGDFHMERSAESFAITIYEKNNSGEWKIIKRIWSDLKN